VRLLRLITLAAVGLVLASCGRREIPGQVRIPVSSEGGPGRLQPEPRILSAHHALTRAPELGDRDAIVVVFSEQIDPATLVARALLVVSKEGHRMPPDRAVLSPAVRGQTRTVLLVGDFTREGREPSDVVVVGSLFTDGGTLLRGFSHAVEPFEQPDRVVLAHRLPGDGKRCMGASQIVRAYWSDRLGDGAELDLGTVRVALGDGSQLTPVGVERALIGDNPDRGSNVLDLCLRTEGAAEQLRIEAGAFHDTVGHPSAGVDVPVSDPTPRAR
jgi:hypothetical protein